MGKEFIYAREDVASVLNFSESIGLLLLPEKLGTDNDTRPRKPAEFQSFPGGTILFFRPEWVMDDLEVMRYDSGVFAGTYTVRTNVNFSSISLYISGDTDIAGQRRLGGGYVSSAHEWLDWQAHEMRPSPPEVAQTYKQVCKHLFSKISVRGGVHNYHVCKEAAELATRIPTRPPFDYIPWPPPDLDKQQKR